MQILPNARLELINDLKGEIHAAIEFTSNNRILRILRVVDQELIYLSLDCRQSLVFIFFFKVELLV